MLIVGKSVSTERGGSLATCLFNVKITHSVKDSELGNKPRRNGKNERKQTSLQIRKCNTVEHQWPKQTWDHEK